MSERTRKRPEGIPFNGRYAINKGHGVCVPANLTKWHKKRTHKQERKNGRTDFED